MGDGAGTRKGEAPRVLLATQGPDAKRYAAALRNVGLDVIEATNFEQLLGGCGPDTDAVVIGADLLAECPAVIGSVHHQAPGGAIVVLSESDRPVDLLWALQSGAVGFVPADIGPRQLARSVLGVLNGEAAVPRSLVRCLTEEFHDRPRGVRVEVGDRSTSVDLSDREWDVLCLLRQGMSTREIAAALFVSQVTVRSHISALGTKLGASNRQSMIEMFASTTA